MAKLGDSSRMSSAAGSGMPYRLLALVWVVLSLILLRFTSQPKTSSSSSWPANFKQRYTPAFFDPGVIPAWWDFWAIARLTRQSSTNIAPTHLEHLNRDSAQAPFDNVYVVSAWLDTRPLLSDDAPEIVLLSSSVTAPFYDEERQQLPGNELHCFVTMRHPDGREWRLTSKAVAQVQDTGDAHTWETEWIYLQYICPLVLEDGHGVPDWRDSEIFATLSLPTVEPSHSAFLAVTKLPILDLDKHSEGEGISTMCLPPLTGDLYAPFLADYFAHYRALGFTKFYPYLLDPGPETLKVLRELMEDDEGITPIRWGIPKGWLKSATVQHDTSRTFAVDPTQWDLPGLDDLPPEVEFKLGSPRSQKDVKIWYFGQGPATQDCAYRAMADGARWMIAPDYDEWLFLRPPHGDNWPPAGTTQGESILAPSPHNDLITTFASMVAPVKTEWWAAQPFPKALVAHQDRMIEMGRLASAYEFRNTFFCITCTPDAPPREDSLGRAEVEAVLGAEFDWTKPGVEIPLAYTSPVRHVEPFPEGRRTKALVDPWAWRLLGIHLATMSYLEWSMIAGPCANEVIQSPSRNDPFSFKTSCAMRYLDAFGPPTYLVDSGSSFSNAEEAPMESAHSQGGLFHLRVPPALRSSLVELESKHGLEGLKTDAGKREAREVVQAARKGPEMSAWLGEFNRREFGKEGDPRLELTQDWSLVDVMGAVLAERLKNPRVKKSKASAGGKGHVATWVWVAGAVLVAVVGWSKFARKRGAVRLGRE